MVTAKLRRGMSVFDSAHSTIEREARPFVPQLRKRMLSRSCPQYASRKCPLETLSVLRCAAFLYRYLATILLLSPWRNLWFWQFFGGVAQGSGRANVLLLLTFFSTINNKQCGLVK